MRLLRTITITIALLCALMGMAASGESRGEPVAAAVAGEGRSASLRGGNVAESGRASGIRDLQYYDYDYNDDSDDEDDDRDQWSAGDGYYEGPAGQLDTAGGGFNQPDDDHHPDDDDDDEGDDP
ncbi:unnamed protein product [Vitrella brassicaformis CCMP3155]|uniref:RxLR effector protein n=1 Tax=Vitrella brassicaformis (strain CCMP3155) TaxID=1169540 RepID=A0A0G4H3U2_VITBC|nr:unnamed protein product [Vitrella brassicaformis CCMP3155]|mmetsp:Transcript_16008/g.45578  ORF Transcript_16008/g.45578 Transcript_16008/m.45578 type:complete len:124 (-) Transcript_16008:945-1316(-)|eukprot:CEM38337.1 unnamed protein product [Vitrella brassicaformis CCMP3155]